MRSILLFIVVGILITGCRKDPIKPVPIDSSYNFEIPQGFFIPVIPQDNKFTVEGVELGRHLFYEKKLSGDNTMACASCHMAQYGFSDTTAFSVGIDGLEGPRNSMPIFNLAWSPTFFWDGRAATLEEQVLMPVRDPIEMHETWTNAISELQNIPAYVTMFEKAFGSPGVDSTRAAKALAQFVRSIVSGDSPFDRYLNTGDIGELGPDWQNILTGYALFKDFNKGDCIHCHTDPFANRLVTDFSFRNNGLDAVPPDTGYEMGKFKVPSLRNLAFTAPYMHDGRFATLDDVLEHYISGVQASPYIDPVMYQDDTLNGGQLGAPLSPFEKMQLKKFLLSLSDYTFINNPAYQEP